MREGQAVEKATWLTQRKHWAKLRSAKLARLLMSSASVRPPLAVEQPWALLHKMRDTDMVADVISSSAATSACKKEDQWEQALTLLHRMRRTGMTADVISLSTNHAAISACEEEAQWEQSLGLLDTVRELGMIDTVISFNSISPCEEGRAVGASIDAASQDARR